MIYVYTTRIDILAAENFQVLLKLLSPEEQAKAARFVHAADRNRLIAGRLSLQFALAQHGIDITAIPFFYSEYGRPSLGNGIDFNISHSGAIAICALSLTETVGIDIEEIKAIVFKVSAVRAHSIRFFKP